MKAGFIFAMVLALVALALNMLVAVLRMMEYTHSHQFGWVVAYAVFIPVMVGAAVFVLRILKDMKRFIP